jgi:UDP-N-acetylmuramoyl-tripeptide--D-alanyl-D-alanine ligase
MKILRAFVVYLLTLEARAILSRHKPKIIAVTGSVGKTTTKDAIYAAIAGSVHVRKSAKSFNSEIGVPLTIIGLENAWNNPLKWAVNLVRGAVVLFSKENYPEWLVLEVGADRPGDIQSIARWLKPDIAVLTGVPDIPVHVEYFQSPGELLREKRALADHLKPGGKLILNGDESRTRTLHTKFRGAAILYGLEENNDCYASNSAIVYENKRPVGMQFLYHHNTLAIPVVVYGALGRPRVYAATAALAIAEHLHIDIQKAVQGLVKWDPPPGRVRIIDGHNRAVIIDDTYNSSPSAALAALDTLKMVDGKRKIAVLGDMLELGRFSAEAHRQIGERVASCADMLITVGFRSRAIAEAALDAGMRDENIRQYEMNEAERAGGELLTELQDGDVVLVKGSQSIRMERTVLSLMAHPEKAADQLVRMDPEWRDR